MLVEVVFQYRSLLGKCELGVGLAWDEIEQVTLIEAAFAPTADDRRMKGGRRFRREAVKLSAVMRGDRINDRVEIVEIGPGGLVCRHAPYVARGEYVEIVIDVDGRSFRFRAQGVWLKDDGDDYRVGLAFVGMPVCLHKVAVSRHEQDLVDRIVAAAA
ncbi:MAG: PilZ domain-containing protein [Deltaproteobacteria bacterium]|nr:PilZ domain-containing protein [Deltaproteobacteria bacterium]MCW5807395.1 PilZ domain-containing protein [Deltaproteobacteria bacterium]